MVQNGTEESLRIRLKNAESDFVIIVLFFIILILLQKGIK